MDLIFYKSTISAQNFLPCWHLSKFLREVVSSLQVHTLILASIFILLYFGNHINISSGSTFSCSLLWLVTLGFFLISFLFPQLDYISLLSGVIISHLVWAFCISVITSWAMWSWVSKARLYTRLHYLCSAQQDLIQNISFGMTSDYYFGKTKVHNIKSKASLHHKNSCRLNVLQKKQLYLI